LVLCFRCSFWRAACRGRRFLRRGGVGIAGVAAEQHQAYSDAKEPRSGEAFHRYSPGVGGNLVSYSPRLVYAFVGGPDCHPVGSHGYSVRSTFLGDKERAIPQYSKGLYPTEERSCLG
jgi:hypothetical protein